MSLLSDQSLLTPPTVCCAADVVQSNQLEGQGQCGFLLVALNTNLSSNLFRATQRVADLDVTERLMVSELIKEINVKTELKNKRYHDSYRTMCSCQGFHSRTSCPTRTSFTFNNQLMIIDKFLPHADLTL